MCAAIFAGKRRSPVVELVINLFTDKIRTDLNEDYIAKHSGPGKRFPGGPTCTYQNNNVPIFANGVRRYQ